MEAAPAKLEVEWQGVVRTLTCNGVDVLELGRPDGAADAGDAVAIDGEWVSRRHARIVSDERHFSLVDDSVNGTFIQTEDGRTSFVRRNDVRLWGEGYLSLGEPPSRQNALRFRHVD